MQFIRIIITGVFTVVSFITVSQAIADIYTYTDERDIIYFSNTPTSPKYRLTMREAHFDYKKLSSGAYDKLINNTCIKHGIDPLLVKAIIKAESDFDLRAVSPKGAKGLMQLMPGTADDMGVSNIYEPENNIEGGVKYLKRLIGIFKSDLKLVVAAYNAGESAVIKYKGVPPFKETRQYVKKVLKYLKDYEQIGVNLAKE